MQNKLIKLVQYYKKNVIQDLYSVRTPQAVYTSILDKYRFTLLDKVIAKLLFHKFLLHSTCYCNMSVTKLQPVQIKQLISCDVLQTLGK